jgi:hypothetical protein
MKIILLAAVLLAVITVFAQATVVSLVSGEIIQITSKY